MDEADKREEEFVDKGMQRALDCKTSSFPPPGCYKILNIYRNADGNLEYEYEMEPQE